MLVDRRGNGGAGGDSGRRPVVLLRAVPLEGVLLRYLAGGRGGVGRYWRDTGGGGAPERVLVRAVQLKQALL